MPTSTSYSSVIESDVPVVVQHTRLDSRSVHVAHGHVGCAVPNARHLEYFADHARVERCLFNGVPDPGGSRLTPDTARPGLGLELADRAQRFEEPRHDQ